MCKKAILILVLVICVMSVPMTAGATGIYPGSNDYKFEVPYGNDYKAYIFSSDSTQGNTYNCEIGGYLSHGLSNSSGYGIILDFDLAKYLEQYKALILRSTNVWLQTSIDVSVSIGWDAVGSGYIRNGYYTPADGEQYLTSVQYTGSVDGRNAFTPVDLQRQLQNSGDLSVFNNYISFRCSYYPTVYTNYNVNVRVASYTAVIYLQGIDGQDAEQFIVISSGLADIESAVNNVRDEVKKIQGQLDNIDDSINQGFDNVTQKQDTIIDKITSGFANIGNQVKKAVTEAVTDLFVPSEEDMVAQYDKWDALMADRFGAVYESSQIIDSLVDSFQLRDTQETINFPVVSLDIVGTTFEFGGWEVDVIPDGFQWLVDILKLITNIGCTVLFVNGMRSRYESVVK